MRERLSLVAWFLAGLALAVLGVVMWPLGLMTTRWAKKSNCMHHAFSHYRRGGMVVIQRSSFWGGPHMQAGPTLSALEEFSPAAPKFARLVPPPLFDGTVTPCSRKE